MNDSETNGPLAAQAEACPACAGVYRLYRGRHLVHVGMAAGAATLRSEVLWHAQGGYGAHTQSADRVEWEVAPDALFAYQRFLAVFAAATYQANDLAAEEGIGPSASGRHCPQKIAR